MKTLFALATVLAAFSTTANAAEIWRDKVAVYIKGDIEMGDFEKFKKIASTMGEGGFVVLKSNGGNLVNGLEIGTMIRAKKWRSVVVDKCHSVCAVMWLAGVQRYAYANSEIGFHGAYDTDTGNATSAGNAFVGAYLSKLGFSYKLIYEMTSAKPDTLNMLNFSKASSMGISMTVLTR
jgi:hypothetical protein